MKKLFLTSENKDKLVSNLFPELAFHSVQVYRGYPGRPGCVTLQREPLIVLGGDAFSLSSFDGCLDSAEAVASAVTNYLKL